MTKSKFSFESKLKEEDKYSELASNKFLTRGAFLLTPSYDLSIDQLASVSEQISFKSCFSLTKTATGILFKFSNSEDYQAFYKKGFYKLIGSKFCRKVPISCRPRNIFTLYVLDVPEELPVEDIRYAMYKLNSVVEVIRIHNYRPYISDQIMEGLSMKRTQSPDSRNRSESRNKRSSIIRITLASVDEYNILLQNGLNFYDATFFPTEEKVPFQKEFKRSTRQLFPAFDVSFDGYCKIPPPEIKLVQPPRQ